MADGGEKVLYIPDIKLNLFPDKGYKKRYSSNEKSQEVEFYLYTN